MEMPIANQTPTPAKVVARTSECMRRLLEAGLTYDDLQLPIDDPVARYKIVEFWRLGGTTPKSFEFDICYPTLERMLKGARFIHVDARINQESFPLTILDGATYEGRYFTAGERASFSDLGFRMLHSADGNSWMPSRIEHLVRFATRYPKEQEEGDIVALGSVSSFPSLHGGFEAHPCLSLHEGGRALLVVDREHLCAGRPGTRFLAVRRK